eukprot:496782-Rhodomonas_salina.1
MWKGGWEEQGGLCVGVTALVCAVLGAGAGPDAGQERRQGDPAHSAGAVPPFMEAMLRFPEALLRFMAALHQGVGAEAGNHASARHAPSLTTHQHSRPRSLFFSLPSLLPPSSLLQVLEKLASMHAGSAMSAMSALAGGSSSSSSQLASSAPADMSGEEMLAEKRGAKRTMSGALAARGPLHSPGAERKEEGGRRKGEGGRRKEEGGRRKEEGEEREERGREGAREEGEARAGARQTEQGAPSLRTAPPHSPHLLHLPFTSAESTRVLAARGCCKSGRGAGQRASPLGAAYLACAGESVDRGRCAMWMAERFASAKSVSGHQRRTSRALHL